MKNILLKMATVLSAACVIIGLIMMLCETPDLHAQMVGLFKGFGIFALGVFMAMIVNVMEEREYERFFSRRN